MRTHISLAGRDPEDRVLEHHSLAEYSLAECKEKMLDKTLADSFPASDPLSSLPNPCMDSFAVAVSQPELPKAA